MNIEKITTAEEILKETDLYSHIDDGGDKVFYNGFVESLMIEFAKLHVEACKKEIAEKAIEYHDSILKSYPLSNIK